MKQIISFINFTIESVFGIILYCLSCLFPKDKNLWVFGSWYSKDYSDNSKYFFEYILKHHPEIKAYWITKNPEVLEFLRSQKYPVLISPSFKSFYLILRAKVAVICAKKEDIHKYLLGCKTFKIQLWHGIGYKKTNFDDPITSKIATSLIYKIKTFFFPYTKVDYNLVISTSKLMQERFSSAFRLASARVPITGYPRNDFFFRPNYQLKNNYLMKLKQKHQFIYTYMPTHREQGSGQITELFPKAKELSALNKKMEAVNTLFIFKLHPLEHKFLPNLEGYKNLLALKESLDPQELLFITDILITDYSSAYFDFLLLDRPIIFLPLDLSHYLQNDMAFYENYSHVTPGLIMNTWSDLIKSITDFKSINKKSFQAQRQKLKIRYFDYWDGNSSFRILEYVKKTI